MMIGLSEKLEWMLQDYHEHLSEENAQNVMNLIAESAAAKETWLVPLEPPENEDYDEEIEEDTYHPVRKTFLLNNKGEEFYCAFTGPEKLLKQPSEMISALQTVPQILNEVINDTGNRGLVLNPWSDHFILKKEHVADILKRADRIPAGETASSRSIWIPPRAVINANLMLDEWNTGWKEDPSSEKWTIHSSPIMANGNILVVYVRPSTVYSVNEAKPEAEHIINFYRVLEYRLEGAEYRRINSYRFQLQDGEAGWVIVQDGVLFAAVSQLHNEEYSYLHLIPGNDAAQFKIYSHVNRVIANEDGEIIVGYENNLRDTAQLPLMVFDTKGDVIYHQRNGTAILCSDVTLDADNNIWFHLYPSDRIEMINTAKSQSLFRRVSLQGFSAFAMSNDKRKLFVSFDGYHFESSHYILTADSEGNYVDPIHFEFHPTDTDGKHIRPEDCEMYGIASTMKSIVVLNVDNRLFIYDVNDFSTNFDR